MQQTLVFEMQFFIHFKVAFLQIGTVTAGNASGINDGAAAVVLCSDGFLNEQKLTPQAEIVGFAVVEGEPIEMGLMPVRAVQELVIKRKMFYFYFKMGILFFYSFISSKSNVKFQSEDRISFLF